MPDQDAVFRRAGDAEARVIPDDGVIEAHLSLADQQRDAGGGDGFAHGADALNGVGRHGVSLVVALAKALFKQHPLGACDAHADARDLLLLLILLDVRFQRLGIEPPGGSAGPIGLCHILSPLSARQAVPGTFFHHWGPGPLGP